MLSEGQTGEVGALRQEEVYGGALQSTATELLLGRPQPPLKMGHLSSVPGAYMVEVKA